MATIGAHYRPTGDAVPPGTYRVVGTGDPVVLLRVGTDEGRRTVTGVVTRIEASVLADAFEPVPDPDDGFTPGRTARNAASGLYWQFRRFF